MPRAYFESMNLATAFAVSAQKNEQRPAVFWGDQQFDFGTLFRQARSLSAHLQSKMGVKPGDRVALWLKNCPQFVPALFGVFGAGAAVVPINNFLKPDEVSYILGDCDASVVITDATMAEGVARLNAGGRAVMSWNVEEFGNLGPGAGDFPQSQRGEDDLAVIIYTSGTTGHPKGAMLSHGNLLSNVESCRQVLSAVEADRFVVLLPMFHSFMLMVGVLLPTLVGGSMVLVKSLHPAKNVIQEILQRQATILPAIPQFFRALANTPVPKDMPLRICISGGAPLPVEILREFNEKMT